MPIRVQNDLPVKEILEHENIFVMDEYRASHQDIRKFYTKLNQTMDVPQPEPGESAETFRERILSLIQEERAASLRDLLNKETKMRQELDAQNERAKKAAMSLVSAQKAQFKDEEIQLTRRSKELSEQVGTLEKKFMETDRLCEEKREEYIKLEQESSKALKDLHKVKDVKQIIEESEYRNKVMDYIRQEMPDFADKMDQEFEAAKQMYETRDVTIEK